MFQGMEYVYAVYKERSFSKAAEKLFISQPSLSANVKREELSVGYPIFDRSTKPISLTEPGKRYIQMVQQIMSMQTEFAEYLNDLSNMRAGNLVLGGSSLYSSWVFPKLMGEFAKKYPYIQLNLVEASTAQLEKMLLNGEIDLLMDNCEMDETIFERRIFRKEYLVLAVPGPLAINQQLKQFQISEESIRDQSFLEDSVPAVNLKLFEGVPFIMLKSENDTGTRAAELCRQDGFVPEVLFELDQQMTSYNITCSGMGASFISDTLITSVSTLADVVFYKLDKEKSSRNLYFYWKKGRYFSKIMEEFLKCAGG